MIARGSFDLTNGWLKECSYFSVPVSHFPHLLQEKFLLLQFQLRAVISHKLKENGYNVTRARPCNYKNMFYLASILSNPEMNIIKLSTSLASSCL